MSGGRSPGTARARRHGRVRKKVLGTPDRPRLCVFRSLKHIYAQVIDDDSGLTLASASSLDPDVKSDQAGRTKRELAGLVGSLVAKRARTKGIESVVFDRGGYKYHGRVRSLADGAREEGLRF
jgi:large subunit ribosomal protein L18